MQPSPVQPARWRFLAVRFAVGGLLLAAGGLKVYGPGVSAVPTVGPWSSPTIQSAAAVWELALGAWLVSGAAVGAAWVAAVGTFLTLAAVSGYLGWAGVASCGCFGALEISPWWTLGLDAAVLAALLRFRPTGVGRGLRYPPGSWRKWVPAAVALSAAGLLTWKYDRVGYLLAVVRDDPLFVRPSVIDAGLVAVGDINHYEFHVTNRTARTLRLVGAPSTCRCLVADGLPAELPPGESRALTVRVYFGQQPGVFDHRFQLYLEDGGLFRVPCQVTARVQPRPAAGAGAEP